MVLYKKYTTGKTGIFILILCTLIFVSILCTFVYVSLETNKKQIYPIIGFYSDRQLLKSYINKGSSLVSIKLAMGYVLKSTSELTINDLGNHADGLLSFLKQRKNVGQCIGTIQKIHKENGFIEGIMVDVTTSPWKPTLFARIFYHERPGNNTTNSWTAVRGDRGYFVWRNIPCRTLGDIAIALGASGLDLSENSPVSISEKDILDTDWNGSVTLNLIRMVKLEGHDIDSAILVIVSAISNHGVILRAEGVILLDEKGLITECKMRSERIWDDEIRSGRVHKKFSIRALDYTVIEKR